MSRSRKLSFDIMSHNDKIDPVNTSSHSYRKVSSSEAHNQSGSDDEFPECGPPLQYRSEHEGWGDTDDERASLPPTDTLSSVSGYSARRTHDVLDDASIPDHSRAGTEFCGDFDELAFSSEFESSDAGRTAEDDSESDEEPLAKRVESNVTEAAGTAAKVESDEEPTSQLFDGLTDCGHVLPPRLRRKLVKDTSEPSSSTQSSSSTKSPPSTKPATTASKTRRVVRRPSKHHMVKFVDVQEEEEEEEEEEDNYFTCQWAECRKQLRANRNELKWHYIESHNPRDIPRLETEACGWDGCQRMLRRDSVPRHVWSVHLDMRTSKCSLCNKPFARKDSRRRHEESHATKALKGRKKGTKRT